MSKFGAMIMGPAGAGKVSSSRDTLKHDALQDRCS